METEAGGTMDNRILAKNRLRSKVCDNCFWYIENYHHVKTGVEYCATHDGLCEEERTCAYWKEAGHQWLVVS